MTSMVQRGYQLLNDPLRVTVRIAGAPMRATTLERIGESLSQFLCRRLMSLAPAANRRAVQEYLLHRHMPRLRVDPATQRVAFEFHDEGNRFGVSRNACAHWFDLGACLYSEDLAVLASRSARAPVRVETHGVGQLLRKRACRDIVALDDQLFWLCRSRASLWADGVQRPIEELSASHRARVEEVRRGLRVDCAFCAPLIRWQRVAASPDAPGVLLTDLEDGRLPDLVRLLPRLEGGNRLLTRVLCAAVRNPSTSSGALAEAIPQWLVAHLRASGIEPGEVGQPEHWIDRALEFPLLPEVLVTLTATAAGDTAALLEAHLGKALHDNRTRASCLAVLHRVVSDPDAIDAGARARLQAVIASATV